MVYIFTLCIKEVSVASFMANLVATYCTFNHIQVFSIIWIFIEPLEMLLFKSYVYADARVPLTNLDDLLSRS